MAWHQTFRLKLSGHSGISIIEVLVSVAILSIVSLYIFQSFFAVGKNIATAEKVDFSKMIAESVASEIMSDPDAFMANMIWFQDNPGSDRIPTGSGYKYFKKNATLSLSGTADADVREGVLRAYYKADGARCMVVEDRELEVILNFKLTKVADALKLNAAQMANNNTKTYSLNKVNQKYLLVIMDDEEQKLKNGGNEVSTNAITKLYTYVYTNMSFNQMESAADNQLSFLNEGISPWLRLYSWNQLIQNKQLNDFMRKIISIPNERKAAIEQAATALQRHKYQSGDIVSAQMDKEFGATPIVIDYGLGQEFELEVANLSSLHVDVLLKKADPNAKITAMAAEGSVNFIDIASMNYENHGISVQLEVKDMKTDTLLYRLGERNDRYKITH